MSGVPHPDRTENGPQKAVSPADSTLGGYLGHHNRPPAFDGPDGYPYTVSLEVEKTPNLQAPFSGYLVFPRWAETGAGIVGHLETPILLHGTSREEVMAALGALTLLEINDHLREAILRRQEETE
ncbi:MAG: hypothetical protein ABIF09_11840 [Gemmatimonadota bacterium]